MNRPLTHLVAAVFASATLAIAQVTLIEPGHQLRKHVDSIALLHPSQVLLERTAPVGDIESLCVDWNTGDLFVQLMSPPQSPASATTHVFRISPAAGGLVTPIALNTGFGINERGTDMQIDTGRGLLVTQDQNTVMPEQIALIRIATGAIGRWSFVATPPIFQTGTFGMDFSQGVNNSIVPPGDLLFTSDVAASGLHSCTFGGMTSTTHVPSAALPGGGDDLVIQPDGDWIWVGDFTRPITRFLPFPPHIATPSSLDIQTMFTSAGLVFISGSRAAVCDVTGDLYVSFSGATGGTGIFRVDEKLQSATLILTIGRGQGRWGLHDLELGPSTFGPESSIYFTVHDYQTGGEEVWEVTSITCCPVRANNTVVPDVRGLNAPRSIATFPPGNQPTLGNATFAVGLDQAACPIVPGTPTYLLMSHLPASTIIGGLGCLPSAPGELMVLLPAMATGPVNWPGPGVPAVHPLAVPADSSLCGSSVFLQGFWFDLRGPSAPGVLSWRLDLRLGS